MDTLDGQWPASEKDLLALPGVGPYTAAAIAGIVFGERTVAMDGNVKRVLSRFFCVDDPIGVPATDQHLKSLGTDIAPVRRCGDFVQALMELGALVCKPRTPNCQICPWRGSCAALAADKVDVLPVKMPKKPKSLGTWWWRCLFCAVATGTWLLWYSGQSLGCWRGPGPLPGWNTLGQPMSRQLLRNS